MIEDEREGGESDGEYYRIGELAQRANVSKRTIDYYTQLGLLLPQRTESKYRVYDETAIQRLKLIELYKSEKLSLEEIRARLLVLDAQPDAPVLFPEKVHEIYELLHQLEDRCLELKPVLAKLNEKQMQILTKNLAVKGTSVMHMLTLLLEERSFI